uniref:Uncharacterized protein n=1 Tax=Arundo donax TaxID=35708 RepID=A0A0A9FQI3_ARUDO
MNADTGYFLYPWFPAVADRPPLKSGM